MTLPSKKSSENNFMQWIATLAVFMLITQAGIYYGWTSPNTARLLSKNSPIPCTPLDVSWLVSLTPVGSFLGAILGSILVEYVGSKKTVLATFFIMGISWICILCANSMGWLYAARIIGGLPTSMLFCCFSIYLSEISAPKVRGTLISLAVIGIPFGSIFGVIAETYLTSTVSSLMYLSVVLIGMSLLIYLKDTPYYLVKKGDLENAEKSIMLYRKHIEVEEELKEIRFFAENGDRGIEDKLLQLRLASVKKAMFMITVVFALPNASGALTIASYTEVILKTSGFDYVEPKEWVIYSCIISTIFSFLTVRIVDKLGRRLVLGISSIGTAVPLTALGIHFYLLKSGSDVKSFQWLSVSSLLMYSIAFNIGYAPIPSTLLSEMFPENLKSIAACFGSLSSSLFGFIVVKAYQPIVDSAGEAYIFWIHAFLSLIGLPCALFLLIETKGKSFQQIQNELQKE